MALTATRMSRPLGSGLVASKSIRASASAIGRDFLYPMGVIWLFSLMGFGVAPGSLGTAGRRRSRLYDAKLCRWKAVPEARFASNRLTGCLYSPFHVASGNPFMIAVRICSALLVLLAAAPAMSQ